MKFTKTLVSIAYGLSVVICSETLACGESLYQIGRGVSYREYSAPLPGSVLVYVETEAAMTMAQNLANSGHAVQVVRKKEHLEYKLVNDDHDIVLAPYHLRSMIRSTPDSDKWLQRYLPIVAGSSEAESSASKEFDQVVKADGSIKSYLKAIHRKLRAA